MRIAFVSIAFALLAQVCVASIQLDFSAPVVGTVNDANGIGTGFTQRLPGSGSGIPSNDPSLTLDTVNSQLLVVSSRSDFNTSGFGRNLAAMETPALLLTGIGSGDFLVRAKFLNLHADQLSDQIGIFVGASVDNVVRAGIHEGPSGYQAFLINSQSGVDVVPSLGADNQFTAGEDGVFEIGRIGGQWYYSWQNLTNPVLSGSFQNISLPALDSQTDLYVGIFNNDARNTIPQTATLDYFTVLIGAEVPEPASAMIWGLVVILVTSRRSCSRNTEEI
jgi:hypothetical protein